MHSFLFVYVKVCVLFVYLGAVVNCKHLFGLLYCVDVRKMIYIELVVNPASIFLERKLRKMGRLKIEIIVNHIVKLFSVGKTYLPK